MQRIRPRPIFARPSELPAMAPSLQTPMPMPTLPPLPSPQPQLLAPLTHGPCLLSSIPGPHPLRPSATLPSPFSPDPRLVPLPPPALPSVPSLQLVALPTCSRLPLPPSLPPTTNFQTPLQIRMSSFCPSLPPTWPPAAFTSPPLPNLAQYDHGHVVSPRHTRTPSPYFRHVHRRLS
jgi:hypothetical protein